jgi:hypothetical protein
MGRWKGITMSKIDELKADIERLPSEEFAELFHWLSEKGWEGWDKEIEADSQAGRLDFLVREAHEEKAKGILKEL